MADPRNRVLDQSSFVPDVPQPRTPPASTEVEPKPRPPAWPWPLRVAFRFGFAFFLLMEFPFPLTFIPWDWLNRPEGWPDWLTWLWYPETLGTDIQVFLGEWVYAPWTTASNGTIRFVGNLLLGEEPVLQVTGSGDTMWAFIQLLCVACAAFVVTLLWSSLDLWSRSYRLLHDWWRTYLRFVLGSTLITYGCFKIIPTQMPAPGLDRLAQPIGESSPMGLLWTFMGASGPYQSFSGAAELIAGWLLVTRWTTFLGSLAAAGVMLNVALLNYCYDTPVKLFSTRLFVIAVVLALPDLGRLFRAFVLQKPLPSPGRVGPTRWWPVNLLALALGVTLFTKHTVQLMDQTRSSYDARHNFPESQFHGVWEVELFELDGLMAEIGEPELWQRMIIGNPSRLALVRAGTPFERFFTTWEDEGNRLRLTRMGAPGWGAEFTYEQPEEDLLVLDGEMDGSEVYVELRRTDTPPYQLMNIGFRWVQEFPYNR